MSITKRLAKLEVILAVLLLFIPLILFVLDDEARPSISNYAYSNINHVFASLLSLAGALFLFNGTAYNKKWYNIILGLSLFGVVFTPHLDYPIWHYSFASIFFVGSYVVVLISGIKKHNKLYLFISAIIPLALLGHFTQNWYSLFIAEAIAMSPISFHFIMKSINPKINMSKELRSKLSYWFFLLVGIVVISYQVYKYVTDQLVFSIPEVIITVIAAAFIRKPNLISESWTLIITKFTR